MCGRFVLMTPGKDLAERFKLEEVLDLEPRYNIAPTQKVAIIRLNPETLQRRLVLVKWGLIPFWAKDPSIGSSLINARSESAAEKPAFRAAFKTRRCLVPADGFYEWEKREGIHGKKLLKLSFHLHLKEQGAPLEIPKYLQEEFDISIKSMKSIPGTKKLFARCAWDSILFPYDLPVRPLAQLFRRIPPLFH